MVPITAQEKRECAKVASKIGKLNAVSHSGERVFCTFYQLCLSFEAMHHSESVWNENEWCDSCEYINDDYTSPFITQLKGNIRSKCI